MLFFRDVTHDLRYLFRSARTYPQDLAVAPDSERRRERTRLGAVVLTLMAAVVVVDQSAKWWAWRHFPWARINAGGDILVGHRIGAWFANPVTGALLDLLDVWLLSLAVWILVRCRASAVVKVTGALMIGGWGSNLLDRLGLHYWTAPDSVRGVVDFIHVNGYYYNVADFFIIGATPLFLLAAGYEGVRAAMGLAATRRVSLPVRRRLRVRIPALVGAGLVLAVALGAANYGGVNDALCAPVQQKIGNPPAIATLTFPSC